MDLNKQKISIQSGGMFAAAMIWGTWVLILQNVTLPAYFVTIITSFAGFLGLLIYTLITGRKTSFLEILRNKKLLRLIVIVAFLEAAQGVFFMVAFKLAILNGGSVFIPIIRSFVGIITPLVAIFAAKKDFSIRYLIYGFIATFGAIIIFGWKGFDAGGRISYLALSFAVVSVVISGIEYIFQRFMAIEMSLSGQSGSNVITYQTLFSAVFLFPLVIYYFGIPQPGHTANILPQMLFIGIFGLTHVALAFILRLNALKRITASQGAIIGYMEQVTSISLSILFLKETISAGFIIGAVLILGSAIAAGFQFSRSNQN
jgi:drug/metabolite transporter (DMT)-like permease